MAQGIRIIAEGWDVYIDDDWSVAELPSGKPAPAGATVFRVVPVPNDEGTRLGMAARLDASGTERADAIAAIAEACVVGWRGMKGADDKEIAFDRRLISSGRVPMRAVSALVSFVFEKTAVGRDEDEAEAAPKNEPSGSGPTVTPSGGATTTARRRAVNAPSSARKPE